MSSIIYIASDATILKVSKMKYLICVVKSVLYYTRGLEGRDPQIMCMGSLDHRGRGWLWTGREILLYLIICRKYVRKWCLLKRNRIICPRSSCKWPICAWKIEF